MFSMIMGGFELRIQHQHDDEDADLDVDIGEEETNEGDTRSTSQPESLHMYNQKFVGGWSNGILTFQLLNDDSFFRWNLKKRLKRLGLSVDFASLPFC